ncbi:uncharacterized protein LOC142979428 isoform X2 [Anticarsia gemmatalis]|uniref:uncharacterized protein LOC142979428 isoform X2 n=1 Tax=Anticarsia gemmatalis TaxID=129554 RepID=UPI003F75E696
MKDRCKMKSLQSFKNWLKNSRAYKIVKHWRDHRSIHQNIIPASTGACKALGKIIPDVKDKLTGLAFRVPIVNVSVLDITIRLDANTSLQDIIKTVEKASKAQFQNIIKISSDHAVSSDFIGDSHSCILDADSSLQLKPNFFKIVCWYENEYSYACRVLDSIFFSERQFAQPRPLESKITYVRSKFSRKLDIPRRNAVSLEWRDEKFNTVSITSNNEKLPVPPKKQLSLENPKITTSVHSEGNNIQKKNELFKIWNEDCAPAKVSVRQNRNAFFHSCIGFEPKNVDKSDCIKAQQRLENVKKEFTKMVNITEDLLRKSYSSKTVVQPVPQGNSSKDIDVSADPNLKVGSIQEVNDNNKSKDMKQQTSIPVFQECGDYKNKAISDENDAIKKESESYTICAGKRNTISKLTPDLKHHAFKTVLNEMQKEKIPTDMTLVGYNNEPHILKTSTNFIKDDSAELREADFSAIVSKTLDTLIDGLSNKLVENIFSDTNEIAFTDSKMKHLEEDVEQIIRIVEPDVSCETNVCQIQSSHHNKPVMDKLEKFNLNEFTKYMKSKNYNMQIIDEELRKRNIILVSSDTDARLNVANFESDITVNLADRSDNKLGQSLSCISGAVHTMPESLSRSTAEGTVTTISNGERKPYKQDIYDKLDSASGSDSNNSFEINERKSQVIHITDLTNSLEDLARLDKICRIIEISDELSDKLFSKLDHTYKNGRDNKWSFKDLCERIQLDDFCNKMFGKTSA